MLPSGCGCTRSDDPRAHRKQRDAHLRLTSRHPADLTLGAAGNYRGWLGHPLEEETIGGRTRHGIAVAKLAKSTRELLPVPTLNAAVRKAGYAISR